MPTERKPRGVWNTNTEDDELDDEKLEPPVHLNQSFANFVIIDNIPVAPKEKFDKLKGVLVKIVTSLVGPFLQLNLPQDEVGTTKGYTFVEFVNEEVARTAVEKLNNYALDKQHVFRVTTWEEADKLLHTPDAYTPPAVEVNSTKENLRSWLDDPRALDQYAIRYGETTEVLWNDLKPSFGNENQDSVVKRDGWTEAYVSWSPLGSYIATIFPKVGVALWGGPSWNRLAKLEHPGVKLIDFSPCEKYLITASPQYQETDNPNDPKCIITWDIKSGAKLRGFLGQVSGPNPSWPIFKWSHDDKYVARMSEDTISVYETPGMELLEKKSIKVPSVKDFSWSPSDHIISYFVPEGNNNNKPASVVLLEMPSRIQKAQKILFNVNDCKLYWHPSGDYLCVKVDRLSKTKKSTSTDFVIFRMRERGIPVEVLELKDPVVAFAWEPKGRKFAIIHGETPRADISFYSVEAKVKLLKTLEKKSVNQLFWSPQGGFIVLAGMGSLNGTFEFYNAIDLESMGTEEHFNASYVEWDPTGRYVATVVSYWKHQVETGFNIYSFQGKPLKHILKDKFYQLTWRPRPPSLLPRERIEYIKKNIKEFEKVLKQEDKEKMEQEKVKIRTKREALRRDFELILQKKRMQYEKESEERTELRGGEPSDDEDDYEYREQWMEQMLEVKEIVINEE